MRHDAPLSTVKAMRHYAQVELEITLHAFQRFCRSLCLDNGVTIPSWTIHSAQIASDDLDIYGGQ